MNKAKGKNEARKLTILNSDLEALVTSEGLGNLKQSKNLPITFSFRLADLMGKLQPTIKAYVDQKQKLVEKYGDKDKEGKLIQTEPGLYTFKKQKQAQWFQKEFTELLNLELTLDCAKLRLSVKDIPVKKSIICPHCKKGFDQAEGVVSADDIAALRSIIDFLE